MNLKRTNQPTVAVITSTIGRKELARALHSVAVQTYPVTHYVFVDGEEFHQQAREILAEFPNVKVIYLPMNTGANGKTNGCINAAAAFLVDADFIAYLDDDNWYEPQHIESCVNTWFVTQADYVFALRNLCDLDGKFICVDNFESVGEFAYLVPRKIDFALNLANQTTILNITRNSAAHIDTNCYFLKKDVVMHLGHEWVSGIYNDRNVFRKLNAMQLQGVCTRQCSVNYVVNVEKYFVGLNNISEEFNALTDQEKVQICYELLRMYSQHSLDAFDGEYVWNSKQALENSEKFTKIS